MADRTITVDVQSNLREQTQEARNLNRELDRAGTQRSTSRTGSRAADAALGASGGGTTGMGRGTTGAGGRGDERDFARQAQGLGGLVHVYATFAANIYAVTAAFTALSKAQDTDNMIKAADKLSAAYGISLTNVAKNMQNVTDGAISMRDALSMANLGGAAGMSTKQMSDLAKVAKGASLALGRDMTDSIERVYKGTIKVEPELLDELGIMVKVDEANKNYARSLNKTVAELTDFEKHQAFANAVTEQGLKKYRSIIELGANPYSRLLASTKDLGDSTLRVVSEGLAPLVNMLSSNPTALALAIAYVVKTLVGMAVPAVKNVGAAWLSSLEDSKNSINAQIAHIDKLKEAKRAEVEEYLSAEKQKVQVAVAASKQATAVTGVGKSTKLFESIGSFLEDPASLDKKAEAIKRITSETDRLTTRITNLNKQKEQGVLEVKVGKSVQNIDSVIAKAEDRKKHLLDLTQAIGATAAAEAQRSQAIENANRQDAESNKLAAQRSSITAKQGKYGIIAETIKNTETQGLRQALSSIDKQIDELEAKGAKFSLWDKVSTRVGAGFAAVASKLGAFMGHVGLAITAFETLSMTTEFVLRKLKLFSDTSEQASKAADALGTASKTLQSSLDGLSKATSIDEIFKFDSARLTAIVELNAQLKDTQEIYSKFSTESKSSANRFFDALQAPFGFGTTSNFAEKIGSSLQALQTAGFGGNIREDLLKKLGAKGYEEGYNLTEGLGIDELAKKLLMLEKTQEGVAASADALMKPYRDQVKEIEKQRNAYFNVNNSLTELNKTTQDYINSLTTMTPLTKSAARMASLISGIVSSNSAKATAMGVSGITQQSAIMSGLPLPESMVNAKNSLDSFIKSVDALELKEEEKTAAIRAAQENWFGQGTEAFKDIVTYGIQVTQKFKELAQQSATLAVKQAEVQKSLRLLGEVESIVGTTGATTNRRIQLENAQKSLEAGIIAEEQRKIRELMTTQLKPLELLGDTDTQLNEISKRIAELNNLGSKRTQEQSESLGKLQTVYSSIVNLAVKDYDLTSRIKVLRLSMIDDTEKARRIALAGAKTNTEEQITTNNLAIENLGTQKTRLELQQRLNPEISYAFDLQKLSLEAQQEALRLSNRELDIEAKLAELENQRKTNKELTTKDYNRRKDILTQEQKEIQNAKELGVEQGRINKILADRNARYIELNKRTEALSGMSQVLSTENESIYQSSTKQLDNLNKIALLNDRIYTLAKDELEAKILELDLSSQAGLLEEQRLQTQIELLNIQKKLRKEKEVSEQRTASMKSFEETGQGSLSDYGSNMWDYAKEKWANERKQAKSIGETFVDSMSSGIDTISAGLSDMLQKNEFSWKGLGDLVRNTFSNIFRDLASELMKMALKMALMGNQSTSGGGTKYGGLIGLAVSLGAAFMGGGGGTTSALMSMDAGPLTTAAESATIAADINSAGLGGFAKGGIMSKYGPLQLNTYAGGGIADSPQLAVFGEGSKNEAYVPLPDNRSIPVTLTGGGGSNISMGDTNISISIDSSGNAEAATDSNKELAKTMAIAVKRTVQEEMIKAARPGGMLYGVTRK